MTFPLRTLSHALSRCICLTRPAAFAILSFAAVLICTPKARAAAPDASPTPDVVVLSNGDTLHGKFVSATAGKVVFHSDPLGDVSLTWDKIKELHTSQKFGVIHQPVKLRGKRAAGQIPTGTLDVSDEAVTVHSDNGPPVAPIPIKNAQYIMDAATMDKQINHEPNLFTGWNGPATASATLVTATQNQYTFSGSVGLVRSIPTVDWLDPRNRMSIDFSGSFGKITQPGYVVPASGTTPATYVQPVTTKTAIFHADAERDEYFSRRLFALVQTAFDHNFSQDLALQQIYGGGVGWTAIKNPKHQLDLKATAQYEKQEFISGASGTNQNLVGSTFAATYLLHLKLFTYTQGVEYIPAYNNTAAYSGNETNTFAFPAFKNLSFSFGTLDSFLNDPPVSLPPTKRNSFQFTMGLTYAIKSKY